MHPFGELGYTFIEKDNRKQLDGVRTRTIYICNGQLQSLYPKFAHMPTSDLVMDCSTGVVKATIKTIYPYKTSSFVADAQNSIKGLEEIDRLKEDDVLQNKDAEDPEEKNYSTEEATIELPSPDDTMLVSGGEKSAARKSTSHSIAEPARSVSNPAVPLIRPQSPDQPAQADRSEHKKTEAKEPKVKASSKANTTHPHFVRVFKKRI